MSTNVTRVNGEPAIVVRVGRQIDSVYICSIADGVIVAIHAVRNPDKLQYLKVSSRAKLHGSFVPSGWPLDGSCLDRGGDRVDGAPMRGSGPRRTAICTARWSRACFAGISSIT